jgi:hypothetical protein
MSAATATRCPFCPNATRQFASLEALYQHASAKHAEEFDSTSGMTWPRLLLHRCRDQGKFATLDFHHTAAEHG